MKVCEVTKYHGKWSVFLYNTRTFHYIGQGKKKCQELADYLNDPKNQ